MGVNPVLLPRKERDLFRCGEIRLMSCRVILFRLEFFESRTLDQPIQGFCSKHLSPGCQDHFLHIFPTHSEASPADASNNLKFRVGLIPPGDTRFSKLLGSSYIILGCAFVFKYFSLWDHPRFELTANDEFI